MRTHSFPIFPGHAHALDAPLPDIVNYTVIDGYVLHVGVGVDLETVPLDVLDRQIRDSYTRAAGNTYEFTMSTVCTIYDHSLSLS